MQTIEFKTATGKRVMVLPAAVIGFEEGMTSGAASPVTWIHTRGPSVIVAGSIDTVAAAVSAGLPGSQPEAPSGTEIEFMRLERARAELRLAQVKLQAAEVGRQGRRRTGCGER